MTGYTVHTGSNMKFTSGWDHIFQAAATKKKGAPASKAGKKQGIARTVTGGKKAATKKAAAKKSKGKK